MKNYKPSRTEILTEMLDGYKNSFVHIRNSFSKQNISQATKSIKEFGFSATLMCAVLVSLPYVIPTAVRGFKQSKRNTIEDSRVVAGSTVGFLGGMALDFGQIIGYGKLVVDYDLPEVLAIPIATNVISGIYEIGRASYRNARGRLLEKRLTETSASDLK